VSGGLSRKVFDPPPEINSLITSENSSVKWEKTMKNQKKKWNEPVGA
jgi:hypothetical protein